MNLKNQILFNLTKKIILKNKSFKGIHEGESCYLFGNAKSLKYYDLSQFNDRISIGCNQLFLHNDFSKMGINYYYIGQSFNFYSYHRSAYTKKIVRHYLGEIHKKMIKKNPAIKYFLNISDYLSLRGDNIFYMHNFGEQFSGYSNCNPNGVFSANQSALSGMIGLAIYLGFKDVTLVGCDHLMRPRSSRHFFEYGVMDIVEHPGVVSQDVLFAAKEFLDIRVVTPFEDYKGDIIPNIQYDSLTGQKIKYKENYDIISEEAFKALSQSTFPYTMTKNEYLNAPEAPTRISLNLR